MNPTKQQVQIVIDTLQRAMVIAHNNCPVDMRECDINLKHPCGTPMCHAGWYAVAALHPVKGQQYDFLDGAKAISNDLGFTDIGELEEWAGSNPKIWGNEHGTSICASDCAFGPEKVTDLQQIITHWKGVQERLPT